MDLTKDTGFGTAVFAGGPASFGAPGISASALRAGDGIHPRLQAIVVAARYFGVELDQDYCCWALKRLQLAETDPSIQGYSEGVFWERNSLADQKPQKARNGRANDQMGLFNE